MMVLSAGNHVRLLSLYNQLCNVPKYEAVDKIEGKLLRNKPVDHLQPEKQCPQHNWFHAILYDLIHSYENIS